ncbi:hypothetical protein ACFLVH_02145 [Chloroflexota bacterium]
MNLWLIGVGLVAVALVMAIIVVVLDWAGWKGIGGGIAFGAIVGVILFFITKNPIALFIAVTVGIVLAIVWHLIVRLAVGRG